LLARPVGTTRGEIVFLRTPEGFATDDVPHAQERIADECAAIAREGGLTLAIAALSGNDHARRFPIQRQSNRA
jgi:hypothetical protein